MSLSTVSSAASRYLPPHIAGSADGRLIAMAKSGFVFFNYHQSKVTSMPPAFAAKFSKVNWLD